MSKNTIFAQWIENYSQGLRSSTIFAKNLLQWGPNFFFKKYFFDLQSQYILTKHISFERGGVPLSNDTIFLTFVEIQGLSCVGVQIFPIKVLFHGKIFVTPHTRQPLYLNQMSKIWCRLKGELFPVRMRYNLSKSFAIEGQKKIFKKNLGARQYVMKNGKTVILRFFSTTYPIYCLF